MRNSITSLLLSLAIASSAQEEIPGLTDIKDSECQLILPLVDELRAVPTAAEFCSSLLAIPIVTDYRSTAMPSDSNDSDGDSRSTRQTRLRADAQFQQHIMHSKQEALDYCDSFIDIHEMLEHSDLPGREAL
ncbi:hypothetical protein J4E83_009161 [Alternaria metachromatica]|uniref:uncharacterized protein n=1 Tax=Alternaria metachromatica TaxID=283354 RepID=UPI0020C4AAA4|nr:uncharacterized protein J4E83_009161 [Alternaria metachromatica]KAI4608358.1 hypothetical protein J4E83_009161 [Alternaria metachromatica]